MKVTEILKNQDLEGLKRVIGEGVDISKKDIIDSLSGIGNINEEFVQCLIDNDLVEKAENHTVSHESMRIYDVDSCPYDMEDMEYMSDGMWIHKDDCWW